jgi:hypothetical protein
MSDEKATPISLSIIPSLQDDGSNWSDFHRRVEEALTMAGLKDTMQADKEPKAPMLSDMVPNIDEAAQQRNAKAQEEYEQLQKVYAAALPRWEDRQARACMAIRTNCGYNNYERVKDIKRVYIMLEKLSASRAGGTGKLIDLYNQFYGTHLSDCKSVAEFAAKLQRINNELRGMHESAPFTVPQLNLRFLQGLGSAYDVFIATVQQTHAMCDDDKRKAIDFNSLCQLAYNEESRQASSANGAGQAMAAVNGNGGNGKRRQRHNGKKCTGCGRFGHEEHQCRTTHPHLQREWEQRQKDRKRKRDDNEKSGRTPKKQQTETPASGESVDTGAVIYTLPAIDTPVAGQSAAAADDAGFLTPVRALQNDWIVDTGCTNHATGNRAAFEDFRPGNFGTCGGVGGSVKFEGIGTVKISVPGPNKQAHILRLTDVKYCPQMGAFNLISASQLYKKGAQLSMSKDAITWKVGKLQFTASARDGLWLLDQDRSPTAVE